MCSARHWNWKCKNGKKQVSNRIASILMFWKTLIGLYVSLSTFYCRLQIPVNQMLYWSTLSFILNTYLRLEYIILVAKPSFLVLVFICVLHSYLAIIEMVRDGSTIRAFLLPNFEYVTVMLTGIKVCTTVRITAVCVLIFILGL